MRIACVLILSLVCAGSVPAQVPFGPSPNRPQVPGGSVNGESVNVDPDLYQWSHVYDEKGASRAIVADNCLADYRVPPGWTIRHAKDVYGVAATPAKKVAAAKAGCDCGPGCACPSGACAGGTCGTQPVGAEAGRGEPVATSGTILVEQTIRRADGTTYTRVVERPAGYVPMSGITQAAFGGGTAARPGAAGTENHTHTCPRCGTTWGGVGHSHSCPRCGTPQYVQDQPGYSPRAATYYPGRPVAQPQYRPVYSVGGGCASGGCANGACGMPAQFSPWR